VINIRTLSDKIRNFGGNTCRERKKVKEEGKKRIVQWEPKSRYMKSRGETTRRVKGQDVNPLVRSLWDEKRLGKEKGSHRKAIP